MTLLNELNQNLFGEFAEIVYTFAEGTAPGPRWHVVVRCEGDTATPQGSGEGDTATPQGSGEGNTATPQVPKNLGTGTGDTKDEAKRKGAQAAYDFLLTLYANDIKELDE
ncbi:hypothetical protein EST38_g357 [Candolleomyces aberdarensis]|uniref:Uncharacterized protein n=1 Tax=Candolleomyces aberdarensis TaxID=2316362 RepID=A0A4Q2E1F2_9AGAR|nr:hypothetical protein EST38_g357 [Candolleomyces aberdarensis]